MPRFTRYGLFFSALAVMILLAVSLRKHSADPAPASRPIHEWDMAELVVHLNRRGLEVRLRAVPKNGPLNHSAYLTATAKDWRDLNVLSKDPKRIEEWRGTLYCERAGEDDTIHLIEQWGAHCLLVGPFLFYGDAELLERVRDALSEFVPPAAP